MTNDLQTLCADLARRQEETRGYADEVHRRTLELMRQTAPSPMMVYLGSALAGGALVLCTVVLMRLAGW